MIESFVAGIARGFGAFGWCLAFLGGWAAVLIVFAVIAVLLRIISGEVDSDDE